LKEEEEWKKLDYFYFYPDVLTSIDYIKMPSSNQMRAYKFYFAMHSGGMNPEAAPLAQSSELGSNAILESLKRKDRERDTRSDESGWSTK